MPSLAGKCLAFSFFSPPVYAVRWPVVMNERATCHLAEGGQEALASAIQPLDPSVLVRLMHTEAYFTPLELLEMCAVMDP